MTFYVKCILIRSNEKSGVKNKYGFLTYVNKDFTLKLSVQFRGFFWLTDFFDQPGHAASNNFDSPNFIYTQQNAAENWPIIENE